MSTEKKGAMQNPHGNATAEQIAEWKKQSGEIFQVTVTDTESGESYACYLRKPTRQEVSYANKLAETNGVKSNEYLLKSCWLGGDDKIQTNDNLFFGACGQLKEILTVADAEIKKL